MSPGPALRARAARVPPWPTGWQWGRTMLRPVSPRCVVSELEAATGWRVRRDAAGSPQRPERCGRAGGSGLRAGRQQPERSGPALGATGTWARRRSGGAERLPAAGERAGVEIVAPSPAGVFYGTRTLRQLLPAALLRSAPAGLYDAGVSDSAAGRVELEGVEIEDGPRFAWRGHPPGRGPPLLPQELRAAADRPGQPAQAERAPSAPDRRPGLAVPGRPLPAADRSRSLAARVAWRATIRRAAGTARPHGGFYTKADLAEIVAYAARRFVTVVPEVDMPGHMLAAIASYPELGQHRAPVRGVHALGHQRARAEPRGKDDPFLHRRARGDHRGFPRPVRPHRRRRVPHHGVGGQPAAPASCRGPLGLPARAAAELVQQANGRCPGGQGAGSSWAGRRSSRAGRPRGRWSWCGGVRTPAAWPWRRPRRATTW